MSTLDNSCQFPDDIIETEARLLEGKSKVDLKLYQRNSMNKINFRSHIGKNYLCSSNDKFRKIRVPIAAVLLKVLESKNQKNLQRMHKIKKVIYSSILSEIINKYAINSDELFSNFAFAINQLQSERENLESALVKKINNEPFFDKIIMESFYETFYDPSHQRNLTTSISKWIKNQLGISIIFVQNQTQVETDSVIFLRKNQKNQILRQVKSFDICSLTSIIDEPKDVVTPLKSSNRVTKELESNRKNFQSISSIGSPNVRASQKKDAAQQLILISVQNSIQSLNEKQNKRIPQNHQDEDGNCPITKRKDPSSESRFWKIFCCGSD